MATPLEVEAMRRALTLAASADAPPGPNPRVGCVLIAPDGAVIAEGCHRGAGTAHAEADALAHARERAAGATAVVTLEPCNHHGRTPPCADALVAAGVVRVVYAQPDPHVVAAGGAMRLRDAGVDVEGGVLASEAAALNEPWTFAVTYGRPLVTWKVAATLDGRVAAADGTSRWISGERSRAQVHDLRSAVDAILVGTGTAVTDDPQLTARTNDGVLADVQPLRVVVGMRDLPSDSRVLDTTAETLHLRTHDPVEVLDALHAREIRHVLLEGGPTVAAAFVRAGLVDRIVWYVAPVLLGAGAPAIGELGIETIGSAIRLAEVRVEQVGEDARISGVVARRVEPSASG